MLPRKMALVRFKTEAVKIFLEEFSWQCTIFRPISFLKSHRKGTLRIFLYCYTRDIHDYPQRQRHFRTSPERPFLSSNGLISELTSLILGDIPPTGCTIFRFVFSHADLWSSSLKKVIMMETNSPDANQKCVWIMD